jgi:hypothetical protein
VLGQRNCALSNNVQLSLRIPGLFLFTVCKEGEELTEIIIDAPKDAFKTQLGDTDGSKAKPDSNTKWTADVVTEDAEKQPYIEVKVTGKDGKPVKKMVAVELDGNVKVGLNLSFEGSI